MLVLSYTEKKGIHIVNSMKRYVKNVLSENVKTQRVYTRKLLRGCFKIKDETNFKHQHDIILYMNIPHPCKRPTSYILHPEHPAS